MNCRTHIEDGSQRQRQRPQRTKAIKTKDGDIAYDHQQPCGRGRSHDQRSRRRAMTAQESPNTSAGGSRYVAAIPTIDNSSSSVEWRNWLKALREIMRPISEKLP